MISQGAGVGHHDFDHAGSPGAVRYGGHLLCLLFWGYSGGS